MRYRKVESDRAIDMHRVAFSFSRVEACQELRGQIAQARALVRHMRASIAEAQSLVAQSRAQLRDCYQLLSKVGSDSPDGLSPETINHENRGAEATEALMALAAQLTSEDRAKCARAVELLLYARGDELAHAALRSVTDLDDMIATLERRLEARGRAGQW
jgi:hypothetical protein